MGDSLKQRILADMKEAMRAKDKERLGVIRLILAAIKQVEVDERIGDLDDSRVSGVMQKMLKQRRDSISQYEAGGRPDLAQIEQNEIAVIETYLPEPLAETELARLIDLAIQQTGATSMRDMGKVMGLLKEQIAGRADMAAVSKLIKGRLG